MCSVARGGGFGLMFRVVLSSIHGLNADAPDPRIRKPCMRLMNSGRGVKRRAGGIKYRSRDL
eukprot:5492502-Pyramimonas_sp.AAC.1